MSTLLPDYIAKLIQQGQGAPASPQQGQFDAWGFRRHDAVRAGLTNWQPLPHMRRKAASGRSVGHDPYNHRGAKL